MYISFKILSFLENSIPFTPYLYTYTYIDLNSPTHRLSTGQYTYIARDGLHIGLYLYRHYLAYIGFGIESFDVKLTARKTT